MTGEAELHLRSHSTGCFHNPVVAQERQEREAVETACPCAAEVNARARQWAAEAQRWAAEADARRVAAEAEYEAEAETKDVPEVEDHDTCNCTRLNCPCAAANTTVLEKPAKHKVDNETTLIPVLAEGTKRKAAKVLEETSKVLNTGL